MLATDASLTASVANSLAASTTGTVTAKISDTAANLATLTGIDNVYSVLLVDTYTLAELKAIDKNVTGIIELNDPFEPLSGSIADLLEALSGLLGYSGAVTVTDSSITADDANNIANLTGGIVTASVEDTSANLAMLIRDDNAYSITLSDAHTLAQLKAINNATTGNITLSDVSVALSGLNADLTAALSGINGYTGDLTASDANLTPAEANALAAATTGTISASISGAASELATLTGTANSYNLVATDASLTASIANSLAAKTTGIVTAIISDTAANLATLTGTGNAYSITLSDAHTLAQLKAINNATTGTITLGDASVAMSGLNADLTAALSGISGYTGDITVSDTYISVTEANALAAATTGAISASVSGTASELGTLTGTANSYNLVVTDASITASIANSLAASTSGTITATISDTVANLLTVTGTGNVYSVTLTDAHTLAQLKTINNAMAGTITLSDPTVALSGSNADLTAALSGITGYTGDLTLTDTAVTAAEANVLAAATTGAVSASLIDSSGNLATLTGSGNAYSVTLTDEHTLAELKAINNATTGTIMLNDASIGLSGSSADLIAALSGISGYAGDLTASDADITVIEANTLAAATTGTVTAKVSGTATELASIIDTANNYEFVATSDNAANLASLTGTGSDYSVTLSDAHTLAQLKAINNATTGTITLSDNSVALAGSNADLTAALNGISGYMGNITVSDTDITVSEANALAAATTGAVAASVIGTASELATLTGTANSYNLEATDTSVTVSTANSLAATTTGKITAKISDSVANLINLTGTGNAYSITMAEGVEATFEELLLINLATTGSITLNSQTATRLVGGSAETIIAALEGVTNFKGNIGEVNEATIEQANFFLSVTEGNILFKLSDSYTTGGTLVGLKFGDTVVLDSSNVGSGFSEPAQSADQVTSASDWYFNQENGLFTWWDSDEQAKNSLTLDGVGSLDMTYAGFAVQTLGTGVSYAVTMTEEVDTVKITTVGNTNYPLISGFTWGTDKIELTIRLYVGNANGDPSAVSSGVNSGNVAVATLPETGQIPYSATEELFIAERDLTGVTKDSTKEEIINEALAQLSSNGINEGAPLRNNEGALVMMDNGVDSFLFLIIENGFNSEIEAGELTLVGVFEGLGAENISGADFV